MICSRYRIPPSPTFSSYIYIDERKETRLKLILGVVMDEYLVEQYLPYALVGHLGVRFALEECNQHDPIVIAQHVGLIEQIAWHACGKGVALSDVHGEHKKVRTRHRTAELVAGEAKADRMALRLCRVQTNC